MTDSYTTGNSVITDGVNVPTDGAKPIVNTVITQDADADGSVDRAEVTFSENISDASLVAANFEIGDVVVTGASTTSCAGDATANDNKACFTLTNGTEATGTNLKTFDVVGTGLQDANGNAIALLNDAGLTKTD